MNENFRYILLSVSIAALITGCGTLANGRGRGQDATLFPNNKVLSAAVKVLREPSTWVPAAGAAAFSLGDFDERVSNWAYEKTPIFGSTGTAKRASDHLKAALTAGTVVTVVAIPSSGDPKVWGVSKLTDIGVEAAALVSTSRLTQGLKEWTGRKRPNGSDKGSFPSMHSSKAFAFATLGIRNLDSLSLSSREKSISITGFRTFAALTAWARIEGGMHYPSDVLVGAALGSFLAGLIHELDDTEGYELAIVSSKEQVFISIRFKF